MAKLMAPNIRIDWYPEGHFQDIHNPTIAELNSGVNLSCAIVTGYTLDFTDSNTEDTTTIFDTHASESILNHSYEADLEFFLAPRGSNADNEEAYRKAEELFYNPENRVGYLAKRFGFPWNKEYNIEHPRQKVDLFKVQADLPKVVSEDGAPILLNVKYIPQGEAVSGTKAGAITYEWEGEPHASTSVKKVDGEVVSRNLIVNGDFENGSHGWGLSNATLSVSTAYNDRMWGGLGGKLARIRVGTTSQYSDIRQELGPVSQGQWVAVSAYVATRTDMGIRAQFIFQRESGGAGYGTYNFATNAVFYAGQWIHYAYQAPHDSYNVRLQIQSDVYQEETTGKDFWVDKVAVAAADSEEAALSQVATYFDGDTEAK